MYCQSTLGSHGPFSILPDSDHTVRLSRANDLPTEPSLM